MAISKIGTNSLGNVADVSSSTTLSLKTAGTTAVTVDASQNVGIGTASPSTKFHVYSSGDVISTVGSNTGASIVSLASNSNTSGAYNAILSSTASGQNWYIGGYGVANTLVFATGASTTERMRIDSSGNVLVNTTSVQGGLPAKIAVDNTGSSTGSFVFSNDAGANQWTGWVWNKATTGNNLFIQFTTEGTLTGRGSITYNRASNVTAFNTTSDRRLKENITLAPSAISKIQSIEICSFDWKETGSHVDFGVIAQDLYEVAPESVTEGSDNPDGSIRNYWGVDTSVLVPALIKAVQELKAIIDAQAERIAVLEGK